MFCNECGAKLPGGARFCGQCGRGVVPVAARAPAPAAPDAPSDPGAGPFTGGPPGPAPRDPSSSSPRPGGNGGSWLDPRDFEHPSMQRMNQAIRNSLFLRKSAESLSRKIGKPWYESTFNSIPATEKQYARIHELGFIAARRLGASGVPSIYVELDRGYQTATYGSDTDAFVNIGSFLPRFFNDRELLFIIGHEIGHLVSQHAMWTTVSMFLVGQQRQNIMSEGVMGFLSNPLKVLESGVETAITNWMRIADFTADRAALLAAGGFDAAKRALILLHLKNRRELDEMDIDSWIEGMKPEDMAMTKVSQMLTSATPYLRIRLIELKSFVQTPQYETLRRKVETESGLALDGLFDDKGYLKKFAPKPQPAAPPIGTAGAARPGPRQAASGPAAAAPLAAPPRSPAAAPAGASPAPKVKMLSGNCPKCRARFVFRVVALPDKPHVDVPCKGCGRTFRLKLDALK
jgi:Zn-dependent protease with chaperone function